MDAIFTPGCEKDVERLVSLIAVGRGLAPEWSDRTFCHRVLGETDFKTQLQSGRVTLRRVASATKRIEKWIEDKGGSVNGNGG